MKNNQLSDNPHIPSTTSSLSGSKRLYSASEDPEYSLADRSIPMWSRCGPNFQDFFPRAFSDEDKIECRQRKHAIHTLIVSLMEKYLLPEALIFLDNHPETKELIKSHYDRLVEMFPNSGKSTTEPFWYHTRFDKAEGGTYCVVFRNLVVEGIRLPAHYTSWSAANNAFISILKHALEPVHLPPPEAPNPFLQQLTSVLQSLQQAKSPYATRQHSQEVESPARGRNDASSGARREQQNARQRGVSDRKRDTDIEQYNGHASRNGRLPEGRNPAAQKATGRANGQGRAGDRKTAPEEQEEEKGMQDGDKGARKEVHYETTQPHDGENNVNDGSRELELEDGSDREEHIESSSSQGEQSSPSYARGKRSSPYLGGSGTAKSAVGSSQRASHSTHQRTGGETQTGKGGRETRGTTARSSNQKHQGGV